MRRNRHPILFWCISVVVSTISGFLTAWLVIPYAYMERGYHTVGGEWLLIVASVILPFLCFSKLWRR